MIDYYSRLLNKQRLLTTVLPTHFSFRFWLLRNRFIIVLNFFITISFQFLLTFSFSFLLTKSVFVHFRFPNPQHANH